MPIDPTTVPKQGDPNLWPETVYLPTDATRSFSSRLADVFEALLHRTAWQRARMADPPLVPLFSGQRLQVPPWWQPHFDGDRIGWRLDAVAVGDTDVLLWHVQVPPTLEVASITASLNGDDGPGINPGPGFPVQDDRPKLQAWRQNATGAANKVLIGTGLDESVSKAAYESRHDIVITGGTDDFRFTSNEYLVLAFYGHKGAWVAASTLMLYGITIETTVI